MESGDFCTGKRWSSSGLGQGDAIREWREWASRALAPIDVRVPDDDEFSAHWSSHALGDLHFVQMAASRQSVVHPRHERSGSPATFQLVYSRRGSFKTRVGNDAFIVQPGEFVLLDNGSAYEMEMDEYHEAIDLVMRRDWLERWIPDATPLLGKPISASGGWSAPFGALMETMVQHLDGSELPRALIAGQVGALLSMATGFRVPIASTHRARLCQRILRLIEQRHADPELTLDVAARELGISKRYVHVLLAETGTSFVAALNAARLDRAAGLLADRRMARIQIAEIAWTSGFLDAGYFARLFRKRFGAGPRDWRADRLQ